VKSKDLTRREGGKAGENLRKITASAAEKQTAQRKAKREAEGRHRGGLGRSKQRPHQEKSKSRAARLVRVNPADYFAEQVGDYGPEGGEDRDADGDDARERLGVTGRDAGLRRGCGAESSRLI
jgi:hypothetical protein